jgi:hypothetical protein
MTDPNMRPELAPESVQRDPAAALATETAAKIAPSAVEHEATNLGTLKS